MERLLDVIEAVEAHPGLSVAGIAERCAIPFSTAYRLLRILTKRRWVIAAQRGNYLPGPRALALGKAVSFCDLLKAVARPELSRLAALCKGHAHLGILENDMVTYLVKCSHGRAGLHSREGQQLEAYCSAIGKVLLAGLDDVERERYLADGGFVALTQTTITDANDLSAHLLGVRDQGWAADMGEISPKLFCLAVVIPIYKSELPAAISISSTSLDAQALMYFLPELNEAARTIAVKLSPLQMKKEDLRQAD